MVNCLEKKIDTVMAFFLDDELIKVPMWIKYPAGYKIKHHKNKEEDWISLVNIKRFILNALNSKIFNEGDLYSPFAFSESYGTHSYMDPNDITELEKFKKFEKYRIAIYYRDIKGIFNIEDWKFEEIKSYSKREITKEDKEMLKKIS